MKYPPVHYHDYLHLDKLLSSQSRRSEEFGHPAHDEWLFITVHQAYELWFKQIRFELERVLQIFSRSPIPESDMGVAEHSLFRITSILKLIMGQIDVLETMTPLDFLEFRDFLYPASGFQSFQFRLIETQLGLKVQDRLTFMSGPFYQYLKPDQQTEIKNVLQSPSLFDLIEKWLERTPFLEEKNFSFWSAYKEQVQKMLSHEIEILQNNPRLDEPAKQKSLEQHQQIKQQFESLMDANQYHEMQKSGHIRISQKAFMASLFICLYREEPPLQVPFQIISHLLDIDELLTQWRYRHALMAHRMLGAKIGTGGTSGHEYLKMAAEKHKIFTDFFNLSTFLIPRSLRPKCPKNLFD